MSGVSGIVAAQTALTQAQVQIELAVRLTRIALTAGRPQQVLELVRQATGMVAESLSAAAAAHAERLDVTA